MSLFNISWRTQVNNLLPKDQRLSNLIDFITALLEPVITKSAEFFSFDVEIRKRVKFNAQIVVLGAALNELFGITVAPFILVQTISGTGSTTFIFNSTEGFNPTFIHNISENTPTYIFNSSEIIDTHEFVISIPASVHTPQLERQVINEVNILKLSGTRFIVQII